MPEILPFLFFLWFQAAQPVLIPAGTPVEARLESDVRTDRSSIGDKVIAVVALPIRAAGNTVIPAGSRLEGRVETIEPATDASEGRVRLVFREIQFADGRKVSTWITNAFSASPPKRKLRYVLAIGTGATAGAFIGGHKARTAGILGGILGGFLIASNLGNAKLPDLTLEPGQLLHLELREDFRL